MMSQQYHTELVENAAQAKAEQEQQGKGFKIKFVPQNSSVYDPTASKTFKVIPNQVTLPLPSFFLNVHARVDESPILAGPNSPCRGAPRCTPKRALEIWVQKSTIPMGFAVCRGIDLPLVAWHLEASPCSFAPASSPPSCPSPLFPSL